MHRSLGDFLTDLFQNSVEAGATEILVDLHQDQRCLTMRLADNGKGMTKDELARATDPFYTDGVKHKSRKVGLGLPFVIQTVEMTGGSFDMTSERGRGTEVTAVFNLENVDTPPPGDWALTFSQLLALPGDFETRIDRRVQTANGTGGYHIARSELLEALGGFDDPAALTLLKAFFAENEAGLYK